MAVMARKEKRMDSRIHKSFNINGLTLKMLTNDKVFDRIMENRLKGAVSGKDVGIDCCKSQGLITIFGNLKQLTTVRELKQ